VERVSQTLGMPHTLKCITTKFATDLYDPLWITTICE